MVNPLDITGNRYGRLVAKERSGSIGQKAAWIFECDCGSKTRLAATRAKQGKVSSCGCLAQESRTKHGLSKHPLYNVLHGMRQRCCNPNDPNFHHYGGRGISIYEGWSDVVKFIEWGESNGFERGLEIDRINVNGNYEPNNCRFVTRKVNTRNLRSTQYTIYNGKKISIPDLSEETGIHKNTLRRRILKLGMSGNEAVERPLDTWETRRSL